MCVVFKFKTTYILLCLPSSPNSQSQYCSIDCSVLDSKIIMEEVIIDSCPETKVNLMVVVLYPEDNSNAEFVLIFVH